MQIGIELAKEYCIVSQSHGLENEYNNAGPWRQWLVNVGLLQRRTHIHAHIHIHCILQCIAIVQFCCSDVGRKERERNYAAIQEFSGPWTATAGRCGPQPSSRGSRDHMKDCSWDMRDVWWTLCVTVLTGDGEWVREGGGEGGCKREGEWEREREREREGGRGKERERGMEREGHTPVVGGGVELFLNYIYLSAIGCCINIIQNRAVGGYKLQQWANLHHLNVQLFITASFLPISSHPSPLSPHSSTPPPTIGLTVHRFVR